MKIAFSKKMTYLFSAIVAMIVLTGSLLIALQKPVTIEVDGKNLETCILFAGTVADVLEKKTITIGEHDRVEPGLDTVIKKNMNIMVTRSFKVKIMADGIEKEVDTTPIAIKEAINLAGFELGDKDIVKTLAVRKTVPGQEIEIIRVREEEFKEENEIPYNVERINEPTLEKGLSRTVKYGKNGTAVNTVKVTYHNNEEVKREVLGTETIVKPQNKVVAMGVITAVSRGEQRFTFKEARFMEATAYTYTGYRTATGKNPAVGMVAVDPRVIPMGSKLYVEGYGYAHAADTGGAVKGDRIDVFMERYDQCMQWGRRKVKVYLLE